MHCPNKATLGWLIFVEFWTLHLHTSIFQDLFSCCEIEDAEHEEEEEDEEPQRSPKRVRETGGESATEPSSKLQKEEGSESPLVIALQQVYQLYSFWKLMVSPLEVGLMVWIDIHGLGNIIYYISIFLWTEKLWRGSAPCARQHWWKVRPWYNSQDHGRESGWTIFTCTDKVGINKHIQLMVEFMPQIWFSNEFSTFYCWLLSLLK